MEPRPPVELEATAMEAELGRRAHDPADLAHVLVSELCSGTTSNSPALWKLLDRGLSSRLLSPLLCFSLLAPRVIPRRKSQPEAYRLFLELLRRYALFIPCLEYNPCRDKIIKSVDDALQLSQNYGFEKMGFGCLLVSFYLDLITKLIDSTMEDWGLKLGHEGEACEAMDVDDVAKMDERRNEHREMLRRTNAQLALEVVENITESKKARVFLRLVRLNMPEQFRDVMQRLQFIEAHKSNSLNLKSADHLLAKLFSNMQKIMDGEYQLARHQVIGVLVDVHSCGWTSCHNSGAGRTPCWISFDISMENAVDGKHLNAISCIEILAELTKTLQVVNQASWQETFLAMWVSALRLVQRDREPMEGPMPHLDARLCMLMSIVPLAIVHVLKDEAATVTLEQNCTSRMSKNGCDHGRDRNKFASKRHGLISALQVLGQFSGLLSPPPSVIVAANNAASKAATFISNLKKGIGSLSGGIQNGPSVKAAGSMLHLIVEACIARKLIDTSAYFWPDYVVPQAPSNDSITTHESPWPTFMGGAPLTGSLKNALIMTPASSQLEIERLYNIALNGSEEEKTAAAKILCGASLASGWNVQEHVVHTLIKLLSPPLPFVAHMSMLNAILLGVSCVDIVHILSLFGVVPQVAAALMPLCEAFGSLPPPPDHRSCISDEPSVYSVFSCAFLLLLRMWKFYRPPQEHCIAGRGGNVRMQLTLDYLLLLHNTMIDMQKSAPMDGAKITMDSPNGSSGQPVYIDSFPKLRAWYLQNQAYIASTISGMSSKNPVHQVANRILSMLYRKTAKNGSVSANPSTSGSNTSGSPNNSGDDVYQKPMVPAWEILEATPFVLEAMLTACAHGRLSSRDLTTGLRDLVDFLPASLAAIVSYFSAEITRGIWKPVPMNGTDWPSPAANILSVASEIKDILESAGVHTPDFHTSGTSLVMLPLPMAAFVSLTITFKLDKSLDYIHGVVGQALENCSTGFSWPSMPVIGALWVQKVPRWHDFILLACARSPFTQDKGATTQLIRSCFSSFLGPTLTSGSHLIAPLGVNGLLGEAISDDGFRLPVAPGFLYLRSCRLFHDTHFINEVILRMVIEWAREPATGWTSGGSTRLKSSRNSLAFAAGRAKEAASLGTSLLCVAGGLQLVQVLYEETLPTYLLTAREADKGSSRSLSNILEGYAIAYMLILSGASLWGVGETSSAFASLFSSKRARSIGIHLDFIVWALEGNVSLGCNPVTWKAYVSCLVGLLVCFVPAWVPEMKQETLQKLALGLRGWGEIDLALALLERGGPASIEEVVETVIQSP
ncbi:hypothetical protein IHE45_19G124400 [Dioscorea alata]|uniref:Uncharacterized protein n=3 Tax=Dioscorea alata TaxID=55571 RepID=A0ACB7U1G1_DIOAL|nr:hypothetical protein IHE45_19G124400 [Dioscorea alata]KAH7654143.1 hypothetical protein IHE45_19G124400 [Dioscorea alata]KAH7654144.1 hypothetical protein IHE45_19G124400 [Dioscorea alata]